MRSRRSSQEHVAEVARRRLELLSAELAAIRPDPVAPPAPGAGDGSGEPLPFDGAAWPPPAPLGPRPAPRPEAEPRPEGAPAGAGAAGAAAGPAGPGRHAHRSVGVAASVAGWAQDRLPPTVQGRVRLSGAHLAVLSLVLVAGVSLTAWWVARADDGGAALRSSAPVLPSSAPVSAPGGRPLLVTPTGGDPAGGAAGGGGSSPGSAGAAAGVGPTGAASGSARIVVDVTGKVHRPGIATLPQGARVVDALEAAGGPRRGASLASLNLARVLSDGEQIVVGVPAPPGAAPALSGATAGPGAGSTAATGQLVNLNTADQAQLETLPGVGPVTARAILDFRAEKGSFTSVDELLEVSGIGDATLAKVSPYCTL